MQYQTIIKLEIAGKSCERPIRFEYEVDDWPNSDGRARILFYGIHILVGQEWFVCPHLYDLLNDSQQNELDEALVSNWLRAKGSMVIEKESA